MSLQPHFSAPGLDLYHGDALQTLAHLPAGLAAACVTSPPYFRQRDYSAAGQLGQENTPAEYVAALVAIFREVRRVMRRDGTLWINLGDTYSDSGRDVGSTRHRTRHDQQPSRAAGRIRLELGRKNLIGIPWRVALALQADGWTLRQDIIWSKPNPTPESVRDRCTRAHEYLFLLTPGPRYYFNAAALAEPAVSSRRDRTKPIGRKGSGRRDAGREHRPQADALGLLCSSPIRDAARGPQCPDPEPPIRVDRKGNAISWQALCDIPAGPNQALYPGRQPPGGLDPRPVQRIRDHRPSSARVWPPIPGDRHKRRLRRPNPPPTRPGPAIPAGGRRMKPQPIYRDELAALYCGDCLALAPLIEPETVALVLTDPPYSSGTRREGSKGIRRSMRRGIEDAEWIDGDAMTTAGFSFLLRACARQWRRQLIPGGHALAFIDWRMFPALCAAIESADLRHASLLVWNKDRLGMGATFRNQHELIGHFTRGIGRPPLRRDCPNVLTVRPPRDTSHLTAKPAALLERLILTLTRPGELVVDYFAGAGSTLEAARRAGRRAIGFEIDPRLAHRAAEKLRQAELFTPAEPEAAA